MKLYDTGDPDVIEARTKTLLIMLILGLLMLIPGLCVMGTVFIPPEVRGGDPIPWYVGLPGGGLFAAMGVFFVFARRSTRIDRRNGVLDDCLRILFPLWRTTHKLDEFGYLLIQIVKTQGRRTGSARTLYSVGLEGTHSKTFDLFGKKEDAIEAAEFLSRFLNLDVHDKSGGGLMVREAGTMDEALRDRMRRLKERTEAPTPPDKLKSSIRVTDDSVIADLPYQYSNGPFSLLIVMGFVLYTLRGEDIWPQLAEHLANQGIGLPADRTTFTVIGILLALVLSGLCLVLTTKRESVEIGRRSVTMRVRRLLFTRVTEIPYDELEDLRVSGSGIYARSDKSSFVFGNGLTRAESEYVCSLIKSSVAVS